MKQEDVNLAIRVVLDAFIQTQKYSVVKQMRRNFAKYLSYKRDHNELLLFLLRQLVSEYLQFNQNRRLQIEDTVSVPERELQEKVREYGLFN